MLLCSAFASVDSHSQISDVEISSEELISEDNLLIVDIILGQYRLAGDVFIYTSPEATIVPLQPLFDAIEFPIQVDPVAMKAHGWFLREQNQFDLNFESRQVIIGDQTLSIPMQALLLSDDYDLYVDILLLKQWFPFEVELETSRLRLNIISSQPLPIEKQLEREKKRKRALFKGGSDGAPVMTDNYRVLGVPIVDVNLGAAVRDVESSTESASTETDYSYSVQASSDIAGMQGSLSLVRGSRDANSNRRFTLYKRPDQPGENMLAELGYAELGDVYGAANALVFSGGDGLGADLQFGGVRRSTDFGKRLIEGDATPGWEVELYRNGTLLEFQVVGDDGRYRFDDVPVEYGENVFDVRLFGPQGQERSVRESVRVGDQALPAGEFFAQLNYVNLDKSVFNNENDRDIGAISLQDEEKSLGFFQAGLLSWLSGNVFLASHGNAYRKGDDFQYGGLGFTAALPWASVAFQHVDQQSKGSASQFSFLTSISDTSVSYSHKHYDDFDSDRNVGGNLSDDIELRFTGNFSPFDLNPLSYQVIGNYEENIFDDYLLSLEGRLGFQWLSGRMTIDTQFDDGSLSDQMIRGRARYLKVVGSKTSVRAALDYTLDPDTELTGMSTSVTWRPTPRLRSQFSLNGDFTGGDNNGFGASLSYLFDSVTLSVNGFLQEGGGSSLFLNAEFSAGRENGGHWRLNSQPQANYGRLKARVFLDQNHDGLFNEGDQPLQGVYFDGRNDWDTVQTDKNGELYLRGLRTEFPSTVKLDKSSLEDPYWRSDFDKVAVVSHAGGLQQLDIPVYVTVEAEGSVLILKKDQVRPLPGIPVYARNIAADVQSSAITEFDGYFLIENLVPGDYQLVLDPEALEKFNIQSFQPVDFSVTAEQGVVYLDPIVLGRQPTVSETGSPEVAAVAAVTATVPKRTEPRLSASAAEQPAAKAGGGPEASADSYVFRVQVAAYQDELPDRYRGIKDLIALPGDDGLTRYVTGEYPTYFKAESRLRELLEQGFDGAFITLYINGERLQSIPDRFVESVEPIVTPSGGQTAAERAGTVDRPSAISLSVDVQPNMQTTIQEPEESPAVADIAQGVDSQARKLSNAGVENPLSDSAEAGREEASTQAPVASPPKSQHATADLRKAVVDDEPEEPTKSTNYTRIIAAIVAVILAAVTLLLLVLRKRGESVDSPKP